MNRLVKRFVHDTVSAEDKEEFRFSWIFAILIVVSLTLSTIDYFTGYIPIFWITACFALLCTLDYVLCKLSRTGVILSAWLFAFELLGVFTLFIYTGMPEGSSVCWLCILPACGLFLYKRKYALMLIGAMFLILIFFFWTPFGADLLKYHYTFSMRIRFPLVYATFFIVSFLLESIRTHIYHELERTRYEYDRLYYHDEVTGLINRRGFDELITKYQADENVDRLTLMVIDIDQFKTINDTYGHIKGDAILKEFGELLSKDISCPIARWGGKQFSVICTDNSMNEKEVTKILRHIEDHVFDKKDKKIRLTASIGVAYADRDVDLLTLFRHADRCLSDAQSMGRNKAKFCYINK